MLDLCETVEQMIGVVDQCISSQFDTLFLHNFIECLIQFDLTVGLF